MSSRERWIVYPLLFLTLGIVMRDKILPPTHFLANEITANKIHCDQLQVDRVVAAHELGVGSIRCDDLVVVGPNGRPAVLIGVDGKTKGGLLQTLLPTWEPR